MAGYSATPLQKKLGLKPGMRAALIGEPAGFRDALGELPVGARFLSRPGASMDYVHLFCARLRQLGGWLPRAKRALSKTGTLWVSWPKKSSGMQTDVGESDVRTAGLGLGLVDVKICAVNDVWSGLKFVYRLEDR